MPNYKFAKQNKIWWPARFSAAADGGSVEFDVEFLVEKLTRDELLEWTREDLEAAKESGLGNGSITRLNLLFDAEQKHKRAQRITRRIHGWRGIYDENDEPVAYSEEVKRALYQDTAVGNAMEIAIREVATGAATKN